MEEIDRSITSSTDLSYISQENLSMTGGGEGLSRHDFYEEGKLITISLL